MMPLALAGTGKIYAIKRIDGLPQMKRRLRSMGLTEHERVTVISSSGGDVIVRIRGTRIALGRGTAQKIMI